MERNKRRNDTGELLQWTADTNRLLKAALRAHDTAALDAVYSRITGRLGEEIAKKIIFQTITIMMETEDWSFIDNEGNSSPIMNHHLSTKSE